MEQKTKLKSLLLLSLLIMVIFSACDNLFTPSFYLREANIENYQVVGDDFSELEFEFNIEAVDKEVKLKKNGSEIDVSSEITANKLRITDFDLEAASNFQLNISAQSEGGRQWQDQIVFMTERDTYPEVEPSNELILQSFYHQMGQGSYGRDYPEENDLWWLLERRLDEFKDLGVSSLWLPPANKSWAGEDKSADQAVGYNPYDLWDLGEFHQLGSTTTKYGSQNELQRLINQAEQQGIEIYYDAVLTHRKGGDEMETVPLENGFEREFPTRFNLAGRTRYYSKADEWSWNWESFIASEGQRFRDKQWPETESDLTQLDRKIVDYTNDDVRIEIEDWGEWIIKNLGFNGFVISNSDYLSIDFLRQWIDYVQRKTWDEDFFLLEFEEKNINDMRNFINNVGRYDVNFLDFPLRDEFNALQYGRADMRDFNRAGLVNQSSYNDNAVTFVDYHRSNQSDSNLSPLNDRKYQAYSYILLREEGLPILDWKDYYINDLELGLNRILAARRYFAYGKGHEIDNNTRDIYGYVREGSEAGTGLVMLISQGNSGEIKEVEINSRQEETTFYDYTGNINQRITTDENGYANFKVRADADTGWSIWVVE